MPIYIHYENLKYYKLRSGEFDHQIYIYIYVYLICRLTGSTIHRFPGHRLSLGVDQCMDFTIRGNLTNVQVVSYIYYSILTDSNTYNQREYGYQTGKIAMSEDTFCICKSILLDKGK